MSASEPATGAPGAALPHLDAVEQRVLGSLLEKQRTVPANFPLSLNALRTVCNQTSSRDPVSDYDEQDLERVARGLKDRGLLRIVWSDSGRRTLKYHQTLDEALDLSEAERAVLTVLLLRGPQAPGELKTRTDRLHAFADRGEVEQVLAGLARRPAALVQRLERRPGQQDHRWIHLLGPVEAGGGAATTAPGPTAGADLETVLGAGGEARDARVRTSYDAVAEAYADTLTGELGDLPFETWLLERIADLAGPHPVVEVGCGPGHVTAHLADLGVDASGVDLSPAMIEQARRRFPEGRYDVGDLRRLMRPATSDGWGAVLAWYSLIHLAPSEWPSTLAALLRPLRPGGLLVIACHVGDRVLHVDDWFDVPVDVDAVLLPLTTVLAAAEAAGLTEVEWYHRGPSTERGETTERLYLLGRGPR